MDEIQIDGNTYEGQEAFYEDLNIDPSIGDDSLCGLDDTNTTCKTITKALSIVMPLEGESITLTLSSGTYSGRTGSRPDGEAI